MKKLLIIFIVAVFTLGFVKTSYADEPYEKLPSGSGVQYRTEASAVCSDEKTVTSKLNNRRIDDCNKYNDPAGNPVVCANYNGVVGCYIKKSQAASGGGGQGNTAGSGAGYYCKDDKSKIYHKTNNCTLPANLCALDLPIVGHIGYEEQSEDCEKGSKCVASSFLNTGIAPTAECFKEPAGQPSGQQPQPTTSAAEQSKDERTEKWACGEDNRVHRIYKDGTWEFDNPNLDCNVGNRICVEISKEDSGIGKPDANCVPRVPELPSATQCKDRFGVEFDKPSGANWIATIFNESNSPFSAGQLLGGVFNVFHCQNAGSSACAPNDTPDDFNKTIVSRGVSLFVPAKGSTAQISVDGWAGKSYDDVVKEVGNCGRLQVDVSTPLCTNDNGVVGGRSYNLGRNCGQAPAKAAPVAGGAPITGAAPASKCQSGQAGSVTAAQAQCVLNLRPDVLTGYKSFGWCTQEIDKPGVVNDWYNKLASPTDKQQVSNCFSSNPPAGGGAPSASCTRGEVPTGNRYLDANQTNCLLNLRKDIVPQYIKDGWCSDDSNKQSIAIDWYFKLASPVEKAQVTKECPNIPSAAGGTEARLTTKFRLALNPTDLKTATWYDYTPGGVTVAVPSYQFSMDTSLGTKSIYVQFMDNNLQPIKFSTGEDFTIVNIDFVDYATIGSGTTGTGGSTAAVSCTSTTMASGNGNPGGNGAVQPKYSGSPAKVKVWMASNSDIGKNASQVSSWTAVADTSASSYVSFAIPADMDSGYHAVLVSLHDANGAMLDGNPAGVVNTNCASTINIQPAESGIPAAGGGGETVTAPFTAGCSVVPVLVEVNQPVTYNVGVSAEGEFIYNWLGDVTERVVTNKGYAEVTKSFSTPGYKTVSVLVTSSSGSRNYTARCVAVNVSSSSSGIPAGSACSAYETTSVCGGGFITYDKCTDDKGQTGTSLCSGGATQFYCEGSTNSNCISSTSRTPHYSCSVCPNLSNK